MGMLLCSKSANVGIKPTSYYSTVENMLMVCSKYISTRAKSATLQMFLLTILIHAALFPVYNVLFLTVFVSYHQLFHQFIICYFLFIYDSTQLLRTPTDKKCGV